MASHKVLKGVAHNFAHSFISLMNFDSEDYILGHIQTVALKTKKSILNIDFISGIIEPEEYKTAPIVNSIHRYMRSFYDFAKGGGSDINFVTSIKMKIQFDINKSRECPFHNGRIENPYICDIEIIDDSNKLYTAHFEDWWYPET